MSEDNKGNVDYWSQRWDEGKIGFHKNTVNPILIENLSRLTQNGDPSKSKKIFIPLCGKSLDIAYLLKEGHQVIAVEGVTKAIQELDTENSFGLKFNETESVYETDNGQLRIFCGDLFKSGFQKFIRKYGPADIVWDRGSFIAVEYPCRSEYIKSIQSAVQINSGQYHNFRYLLETVDYDRSKHPGPPRAVNDADMKQYFEDWTNIEIVSRTPDHHGTISKLPDIGPFEQVVYFLIPK